MTTNANFDSIVNKAQRQGLTVELHDLGYFEQAIIRRPRWNASNLLASIRNNEYIIVSSMFSESSNRYSMTYRWIGYDIDDTKKLTRRDANYAIERLVAGMDIYNDKAAA